MQVGSRDLAYDDLGQLLKKLRISCGRQLSPGEQVAYIIDRKIGSALDKIPDVSWAGARQVKICPDLHTMPEQGLCVNSNLSISVS